ncbi:MAG: ArsR/SmtB family transcription factor, partial [Candidatus Gallimonas sp.]
MLKTTNVTTENVLELSELARALSSPQRLDILNALNNNSLSVTELSRALNQPLSSTTVNIDILEQAGLIATKIQYTDKGKFRLCSRICDAIHIGLHKNTVQEVNQVNVELPIGSYNDYHILPSCGLATEFQTIGKDDDPDNFFLPDRFLAKLIWFDSGYVEYRVSKAKIPQKPKELEISFEACSEAPFYRNEWRSDITVWLNGFEIGTWTCPGDFGGRRGMLNPD